MKPKSQKLVQSIGTSKVLRAVGNKKNMKIYTNTPYC